MGTWLVDARGCSGNSWCGVSHARAHGVGAARFFFQREIRRHRVDNEDRRCGLSLVAGCGMCIRQMGLVRRRIRTRALVLWPTVRLHMVARGVVRARQR